MAHGGVSDYVRLLSDTVRMDAYARAIRRVVKPGDVVTDLGCGLGALAVLAALRAARRVYGVESEPLGGVAEDLARANGVADRVVFLRGRSGDLSVPERADVCLFDDLDILAPGRDAATMATLSDMAARWLKPGGRTIPEAVEIWGAPVEAAAKARLWRPAAPSPSGGALSLDLGPIHRLAVATRWLVRLAGRSLLAVPVRLAHLPLRNFDAGRINARRTATARRTANVHGLLCWIRVRLARGIAFDTGPWSAPTAYQQVLMPLAAPLGVRRGDRLTIGLRYAPAGNNKAHKITIS